MIEDIYDLQFVVLLIGIVLLFSVLIKAGLSRIGITAIIGYVILGSLIRFVDDYQPILSNTGFEVFEFLAYIGIISLLFRVGLESNIYGLVKQLKVAMVIWIGDVFLSGLTGYVCSYYILDLGLVTSLFVGTALTATSVGVSIGIWQEFGALKSEEGQRLLDVAELDDISAVILMALLFSLVPVLKTGDRIETQHLLISLGLFILKFVGLVIFCIFFSLKLEPHITEFIKSKKQKTTLLLIVVSIALIIAAMAGLMGFSIAIGAFFAGLVFSRDPQSFKIDTSFSSIYDFFTPFFFIGIGIHIDPNSVVLGLSTGVIILIAAMLGKVLGAGIPSYFIAGATSAILIGVSMVPRAEIAMYIMQRGYKLGDVAVSNHVFSAMVFVSLATIMVSSIIIRILLKREPIEQGGTS